MAVPIPQFIKLHYRLVSVGKTDKCRVAVPSVTAPGGPCLRGICDERAAEITIVISTMYSADAQWYTEIQAKRSGADHYKNCIRKSFLVSYKTARREEIKL
jgi:hypothetical protein